VSGTVSEARAERRRLLAAGRPEAPPEVREGTLGQLTTAFFRAKVAILSPATLQAHEESYRLRIAETLGHLNVAGIDRAQCEVFLAKLVRESSSRQMVEKTIKALRAILKTGVEWGWLAENPAADLRLPRPDPSAAAAVKRVLDGDQLNDLFSAASANPRVESMLRMAGEAGLRRGEVIGLRWPDIDALARRVTVERAVWQERTRGPNGEPATKIVKGPKGGRSRRVAISDGIVGSLAEWYQRSVVEGGADATGYIWPGADGGPMGADTPGQALARVCDRAGLVENPRPERPKGETPRPFVGFHGLRHTAASIMLSRSVPLLVVSRQLGHRNPNVTAEVYAHLLHDAQLDDAMAAFSGYPSGVSAKMDRVSLG
jgi:integrase